MTPAPQSPHDPQHDLSQTLARQADRFVDRGGSTLELDQVLSRAGEIRRGRRMRATMVMAAVVLAIAAPVGINAIGDNPTNDDKPLIAAEPDPSPIRLGNYPTGDAPRNGYSVSGTLYGAKEPIPLGKGGELTYVSKINGGFLVGRYENQNGGLLEVFVSDDGQAGESRRLESGFAVSPERNVGSFVDNTGTVLAVQDGGENTYEVGTLPPALGYEVEAMIGEDCSGTAQAADCTVYVQVMKDGDPNQQTWALSPGKEAEPVFDDILTLAGVSVDGLVAGQVSYSDEGSCWEVRNQDGSTLWETCENSLKGFSPDGKYILADLAYGDGPGGSGLTILDARTGAVVLDLPNTRDTFISGATWDDNTHVVAPVFDTGTWAVQRFSLNGSREYATQKAPDNDNYDSPFRLG